jgi:hypothetical protein
MELKKGDVITFAGIGYTKRGNLICNGRYSHNMRKAKSKIVRLKQFSVVNEAYGIGKGVKPAILPCRHGK